MKPCTRSDQRTSRSTQTQDFQSINTAKDMSLHATSQLLLVCQLEFSEALSAGVQWEGYGPMGCFFCQASSSSGLLQTLETPAAQAAQLGVSGVGGFRGKLMERNLANNGIAISQGLVPYVPQDQSA